MLQMLMLSRQKHDDEVASREGKSVVRTGESADMSVAVSPVAKRRRSLELDAPNPAKPCTSSVSEETVQLRRRRMAVPLMLGSVPKDMAPAYDRMRTRRFAYLIGKGVKFHKAAQMAEAEAMESLATLAKKRGIGAVTKATGEAMWKRRSCVKHMLRRQSIATAVLEAEAEAEAGSEAEVVAETTPIRQSMAMASSLAQVSQMDSLCMDNVSREAAQAAAPSLPAAAASLTAPAAPSPQTAAAASPVAPAQAVAEVESVAESEAEAASSPWKKHATGPVTPGASSSTAPGWPSFKKLSYVMVSGIEKRPELNGQVGQVISYEGGVDRRYKVQITGIMVSLREDKLSAASQPAKPKPESRTKNGAGAPSTRDARSSDSEVDDFEKLPQAKLTAQGQLIPTYSWAKVPSIASLPPGLEVRMPLDGFKCARIPSTWRLQVVVEGQCDCHRQDVGKHTPMTDVVKAVAKTFNWKAEALILLKDGTTLVLEKNSTVGSALLFGSKLTASEAEVAAETTPMRQSIARAEAEAESVAEPQCEAKAGSEAEVAAETIPMSIADVNKCLPQTPAVPLKTVVSAASETPATYVRTRIRKRASLLGRKSWETSSDTDSVEQL